MNTANFLTVTIIALLAVMSPGPDFLMVTRNSLLYSKRVGLFTALGITLGNVLWITASLVGISVVISKTVLLFNTLKLLGAVYLVYLGVKSLRLDRKKALPKPADETRTRKPRDMTSFSAFKTGLITNILNPKAALFFVSFFSVIITPGTPKIVKAVYGLEISLIALLWFSLLATVLSVSAIKNLFDRISLWLERLTGAILIALGIKIAFSNSR